MVQLGLEGILYGSPTGIAKTKVVCTLGPSSRAIEKCEELLKAGMNVARLNFSHGDHSYHQETVDNLRAAMQNTKIMCAVMLDTKGPEIRTGFLEDGKPIKLIEGKEITITTDYSIKGNEDLISMTYKMLPRDVRKGTTILCADGSVVLEVLSTDISRGTVRARCKNTAILGERKNVNLPGIIIDLPTLIDKDVDDIVNWGIPNEIDFIAASFVRKGSNIDEIRQILGEEGKNIKIIAKIENQEGITNFSEIVQKADAIMVARGDMGMEIPTEKIFMAQKMMIQKCNFMGKPVITATQMLESMVKNPKPTRAEATDVANAVLDGTDCVMLSGETAAGKFPVEAVKVMIRICREAEATIDHMALFRVLIRQVQEPMDHLESLASSAVRTAHKVKASLIVCVTRGGSTSSLVAKYRPSMPVLTVVVPILSTDTLSWSCSSEYPARQSLIVRGLIPLLSEGSSKATDSDTIDEILSSAISNAKQMNYCYAGDCIVALHGLGNASVIKIIDVK